MISQRLPFFRFIRETSDYKQPITFEVWFFQKFLGINRYCYWPVHRNSIVVRPSNVDLGVEAFPGYMPGCYIQALGPISIGDHSIISANVGIISSNHSLSDARKHSLGYIRIGRYCWIGMNAMILPNVVLGDFTIVAAGSVVTKSFPDGHCVIGGNPARFIKRLPADDCVVYSVEQQYHGYLRPDEYAEYRRKYPLDQMSNLMACDSDTTRIGSRI
jgi:acetyltransferase-like isoleucine patch superfamily enzyme